MKCLSFLQARHGTGMARNGLPAGLAVVLWLVAGARWSLADLFTFDTAAEFSEFFAETTFWPGNQFVYSDGLGVGSSGGRVEKVAGSPDVLVFRRPVVWRTSDRLWTQVYFYLDGVKADVLRDIDAVITVGLLDSENGQFSWVRGFGYVSVSLVVGTGAGGRQLRLESKDAPMGSADWLYSPPFSLSSGWCALEAVWTLGDGGRIDYSAKVSRHGESGTDAGREGGWFAGSLSNPRIASDDALFFGFDPLLGPARYMDNISVVPELSSHRLAALATLAVWSRLCGLRRKRGGPIRIALDDR